MRSFTLALVFLTMTTCGRSTEVRTDTQLDGPISYRAILEQQNAQFCVEGPDFSLARSEEDWITVFDMQTQCHPTEEEIRLPVVDFATEIAVAAWWKVAGCLGHRVRTTAVERKGAAIVVTAVSSGPGPGTACATALGGLESFLALERSERLAGANTYRFVLDGRVAGTLAA